MSSTSFSVSARIACPLVMPRPIGRSDSDVATGGGPRNPRFPPVTDCESWAGTKQLRIFKFEGDRVTLSTPVSPDPMDGKMSVRSLVWEKLK